MAAAANTNETENPNSWLLLLTVSEVTNSFKTTATATATATTTHTKPTTLVTINDLATSSTEKSNSLITIFFLSFEWSFKLRFFFFQRGLFVWRYLILFPNNGSNEEYFKQKVLIKSIHHKLISKDSNRNFSSVENRQ